MSDMAVRVENLGKRYRIGTRQETYETLRDAIALAARSSIQALRGRRAGSAPREIWALEGVDLDVGRGDVVGIIGRNGAGKSTLLKILTRVTYPTYGRAVVSGRVGSLLEVGAGFHPELTGRENIYLNGAVLGMKKPEILHKFDEIVDFAEIEQFLDTPVKRYSSGMYMRLAFAVAAHLETEILLVDEVLAVGDAAFQRKCLGKMKSVAKAGRTVLFVSHNMAAVSNLCSSALVLEKGKITCQGTPKDCIDFYSQQIPDFRGAAWQRPRDYNGKSLLITQVNASVTGEQPDLILDLDIILESKSRHKGAFLAVDISDATGTTLMQAIPTLENIIEDGQPRHAIGVKVELPPLIPGQYLVTIWVGSHNTETLDEVKEIVAFEILESPTPGRTYPHTPEHGYIVPRSSIKRI